MDSLLVLFPFLLKGTHTAGFFFFGFESTQLIKVSVGEKEGSLQEIRSWFEFLPGHFGVVLRGGYLYGAWPLTILILVEFKFILQKL